MIPRPRVFYLLVAVSLLICINVLFDKFSNTFAEDALADTQKQTADAIFLPLIATF